jgi:hypothetical protein
VRYQIFRSVYNIDLGRKGFDTDGGEHQGRLSYEDGISVAMASFQEAQTTGDCELLILAEETFLQQELNYCDAGDAITLSSLTQAIQSFEDSLRSLDVAGRPSAYREAEKTYPTTKDRIQGCPRDVANLRFDSPGL